MGPKPCASLQTRLEMIFESPFQFSVAFFGGLAVKTQNYRTVICSLVYITIFLILLD